MKIISKFKDYYDYLLGKYGIDEKIVFDRIKIIDSPINHELKFDFRSRIAESFTKPESKYTFRILSICGKYYPIFAKGEITKTSSFRLVVEKDLEDKKIRNGLKWLLPISFGWFAKDDLVVKILKGHLNGVYNQPLVELSKKINQPIFVIISYDRGLVAIDQYTPNLSKIKGITTVYPPELLFNDVSFFIGNVLNNSIDKTHLIISDKDKIVKGGFDLKTSFRNM